KSVKTYLDDFHPGYRFVSPIPAANGNEMIFIENAGYFRLFPFVKGSHTRQVVETPQQAYEAAVQFGRFARLLSGMDSHRLKITIPGFHDLSLRHRRFEGALKHGNHERIGRCRELIRVIAANMDILKRYEQLRSDAAFRLRVMHHDTKISNVL